MFNTRPPPSLRNDQLYDELVGRAASLKAFLNLLNGNTVSKIYATS